MVGYHAPTGDAPPLAWARTDTGYQAGDYTITRDTCANTPTRVRWTLRHKGSLTPCYDHRHLWAAKECAERHRNGAQS